MNKEERETYEAVCKAGRAIGRQVGPPGEGHCLEYQCGIDWRVVKVLYTCDAASLVGARLDSAIARHRAEANEGGKGRGTKMREPGHTRTKVLQTKLDRTVEEEMLRENGTRDVHTKTMQMDDIMVHEDGNVSLEVYSEQDILKGLFKDVLLMGDDWIQVFVHL